MYKKILFFITLLILPSCTTPTKNQIENKNIQLVGKWEDKNSITNYLDNGTFKGQWGSRTATGIWQIHQDTLKMKFLSGHEPYYIITHYTKDTLIIKSITDNEEFIKTKVE